MTIQDLFSALGNQAEVLSSSVGKAIDYSIKEQKFESELFAIGETFYQQTSADKNNTTGTRVESFKTAMAALQKRGQRQGISQSELSAIAISMENLTIHFRREVTPVLFNMAEREAFRQGHLYGPQLGVRPKDGGGFSLTGVPSSAQVRETAERIAESYGGDQLGINKERIEAAIRSGVAIAGSVKFKGDSYKDGINAILLKMGVTKKVAFYDASRLANTLEGDDYKKIVNILKGAGYPMTPVTGKAQSMEALASGVATPAFQNVISSPDAPKLLADLNGNQNLPLLVANAATERQQISIMASATGYSREWLQSMLQAFDSGKGTAEQIDFLKSFRRHRDEFKKERLSEQMGAQTFYGSSAIYAFSRARGASHGEAIEQVLRTGSFLTVNGEKQFVPDSWNSVDPSKSDPSDVHARLSKAFYEKNPRLAGEEVRFERLDNEKYLVSLVNDRDGETFILTADDIPTLASDAIEHEQYANVTDRYDHLERMKKAGFQLSVLDGIVYGPDEWKNFSVYYNGTYLFGSGPPIDIGDYGPIQEFKKDYPSSKYTPLIKHIIETHEAFKKAVDSGESFLFASNEVHKINLISQRALEQQKGRHLTQKEVRDLRYEAQKLPALNLANVDTAPGSEPQDIKWFIPRTKTAGWALKHYNDANRMFEDDDQLKREYMLTKGILVGFYSSFDRNAPNTGNVGNATIPISAIQRANKGNVFDIQFQTR